jgi:hypothetical protein
MQSIMKEVNDNAGQHDKNANNNYPFPGFAIHSTKIGLISLVYLFEALLSGSNGSFPGENLIKKERHPVKDAFQLTHLFYYFRCLERCLAISNIDTWALPPKTAFSFASPLIIRLLTLSCNLFALM